ncbi:MAG: PQQ-binding-like beta-propeller repeat protein [Rhizomicrobium sp.]
MKIAGVVAGIVLACSLSLAERVAAAEPAAVAYQIDAAHSGQTTQKGFKGKLKPLWTQTLGGSPSYPLIAGGYVYVTAAASDGSGTVLFALKKKKGQIAWQQPIGDTYHWSAIAYDGGQVFAVNSTGLLAAYNSVTGAQNWSAQMPDIYSGASPPTAIDGVVYVGGYENFIYAVDETTGSVLWQANVSYGGGQISSPATDGTSVFVSYPCQYYAFSASNGQQLWEDNEGCNGGGGATPALYNGQVFIRDQSSKNRIASAGTGQISGTFPGVNAPAFVTENSDADVVSLNGSTLTSTDASTQATLWTFAGDGTLSSAPIVVSGYVIEGSGSGDLYVVNAATGKLVSSRNIGVAVPSPEEGYYGAPLTGLAAGMGMLVVPAGNEVFAFTLK